jgi:hypothetical protein
MKSSLFVFPAVAFAAFLTSGSVCADSSGRVPLAAHAKDTLDVLVKAVKEGKALSEGDVKSLVGAQGETATAAQGQPPVRTYALHGLAPFESLQVDLRVDEGFPLMVTLTTSGKPCVDGMALVDAYSLVQSVNPHGPGPQEAYFTQASGGVFEVYVDATVQRCLRSVFVRLDKGARAGTAASDQRGS